MSTQELILKPQMELAANFMPVFTPQMALQRYQVVKDLVDQILKKDHDFGVIPGTGDKATLLKPGAEKLCTFFGLVPRYIYEDVIENWGGKDEEPLFSYRIKCQLWRMDYMAGEGIGYASSRESKHRYRWVDEDVVLRTGLKPETLVKRDGKKRLFEFSFGVDKAETTGQYGKPEAHWQMFREAISNGTAKHVQKQSSKGKTLDGWEIEHGQIQYRVPNPDIADVINTVLKMGMKRALVAAVIITVNVSDRFTQDVEDFTDIDYIDVTPQDTNTHKPESKPAVKSERKYNAAVPGDPLGIAIDPHAEPAQDKPWHTRKEMANVFAELQYNFERCEMPAAYGALLREHGVDDPSKFMDPQKALDCYAAMFYQLQNQKKEVAA